MPRGCAPPQAKNEGSDGDEIGAEFRQWIGSVPGIDEAMALSTVLSHVESGEFELIIFDTAPTGHTLRLLQLPTARAGGGGWRQAWGH